MSSGAEVSDSADTNTKQPNIVLIWPTFVDLITKYQLYITILILIAGFMIIYYEKPSSITTLIQDEQDIVNSCVERFAPKMKLPPSDTIDFNGAYVLCNNIAYTSLGAEEQRNLNTNLAFQMSENVVIMWMVVLITTSGVFLSGLQLLASYKLASMGKGQLANGGRVKLGRDNIVVQSSVVGVIILSFSFIFFFVFVKYVYTITPLSSSPQLSAQSATAPPVSNVGFSQKPVSATPDAKAATPPVVQKTVPEGN
jgi:hypothetical protein